MKNTKLFFVLVFFGCLFNLHSQVLALKTSDTDSLNTLDSHTNTAFNNGLMSIDIYKAIAECNPKELKLILQDIYNINDQDSLSKNNTINLHRRLSSMNFNDDAQSYNEIPNETSEIIGDFYHDLSVPDLINCQDFYALNLPGSYYLKTSLISPLLSDQLPSDNYANKVITLPIGSRIEAGIENRLTFGLDIAQGFNSIVNTNNGSIEIETAGNSNKLFYNFDFNLKQADFGLLQNLTLKAEILNNLSKNILESSSNDNKNQTCRISLAGTINRLSLNWDYEKIEEDFFANNDYESSTSESFKTNLIYKLFDWMKVSANFAVIRDYLDKAADPSSHTQTPQISLLLNPIPSNKDLSLNISYSSEEEIYTGRDSHGQQDVYSTILSYRLKEAYVSVANERSITKQEAYNNASDHSLNTIVIGLKPLDINHFLKVSASLNSTIKDTRYKASTQQNVCNNFLANLYFNCKDLFSVKSTCFVNSKTIAKNYENSILNGWGLKITVIPKDKKLDTEFSLKYEEKSNDYRDNAKDYNERAIQASFKLKL